MNGRKLSFGYLVAYLAVGGLGLALMPTMALQLLFSNGTYDDIMVRMTGMFMCVLSFLIYNMLRFEDWKYYPLTIYARSGIVLFLVFLYIRSGDPLFITVIGIVLIGLIPSVYIHFVRE